MGIVKIRSGEPATKSSYNCEDDELTQEERMLLQRLPSHESDESEHAEVGSELATSTDQIFNVPYGLYDLPDLKEVLSLETWNLCLTEDDRFCLAAYLPDMDPHDFVVTMDELLSGSSMFFGSPLRSFFDRLSGGLYSPQVSQASEGLLSLQRRGYYHFLKSYHDGMIQTFTCMKRLWRSSDISTSLEEKIHVWNNWKYNKSLTSVDLNSYPFDENLSIKSESEAAPFSQMKQSKHMDRTVTTQCSTFASMSAKEKEVTRGKSVEMSSLKNHLSQPLNLPWEKCDKRPKGVLKIRNKGAALTDEKERTVLTPGLTPISPLAMHGSRFSPPHCAPALDAHNFAKYSSYPYCTRACGSTSGNSHLRTWQTEDALETDILLAKSSLSITVPTLSCQSANCSLDYSNEACNIKKIPNEKNFLKNFGQQNGLIHESSPDPYTCATDGHQRKGYLKMYYNPKNAKSISEMLTLGTSIQPSYASLSEQSETMHKYHDDLKSGTPSGSTSVSYVEKDHRFPVTYRRRKAHKKLNVVNSIKKSNIVVDLESPGVLASMANVKPKAIKL